MYANHQPIISEWARRSSDNMARVLQMTVISARQKFFNVPALMEQAESNDPSGALYGWKVRAYNEFWSMRHEIHWQCQDIMQTPETAEDNLVAYLASLHGLGFAKAGFAVQMLYGLSGCLDSVNIQRLGIDPYITRSRAGERPVKLGTYRDRVAKYNHVCHLFGGSAKLWDDWCEAIARRYPSQFKDANAVSAYHLACFGMWEYYDNAK